MGYSNKKLFFIGFLVINTFLSSYFVYVWDDWNSVSRILPAITFCENHTIAIDKYHEHTGDKSFVDEHYYSDKAPLPTFLLIPIYEFFYKAGIVNTNKDVFNEKPIYILASILFASFPFSLIILLCVVYSKHTEISPVIVAMLSFYGSFIFVYTGTFYSHIFSGLLLLASYILLKFHTRFFLSGFILGLGFLTEYTLAIAFPIWILQLFLNCKKTKLVRNFCLGFLPAIIFILAYNYSLTGSLITLSYRFVVNEHYSELNKSLGFHLPQFSAIWDLLFSQFRGIFFYFPFLILVALLFIKNQNIKLKKITHSYLLFLAIFYFLLISSHAIWWGGWVFGPRHLIPILILLGFESIVYLSKNKFPKLLFWILSSVGIIIMWMTKSTIVFDVGSDVLYPVTDVIIPEFFADHFNSNNILTMLFDLQPKYAVILWLVLFVFFTMFLTLWHKKIFTTQ